MPYLESVLDVYESVLQKSPNYSDNAASKVKQEILHGLGNVSMPHGFQIIYTYMCVYYIINSWRQSNDDDNIYFEHSLTWGSWG